MIGYQIHLDPPCIDLGIVMIDSDVCQQSFTIVNNGNLFIIKRDYDIN